MTTRKWNTNTRSTHSHTPVGIRFAFAFISSSVLSRQQPEFLWNVSVGLCLCAREFLLTLIFNSATLLHLLFVILFKCKPIFTWRIRNGKVILPMNKMLNEGAFLSLSLAMDVCVPTKVPAVGKANAYISLGLHFEKLEISCQLLNWLVKEAKHVKERCIPISMYPHSRFLFFTSFFLRTEQRMETEAIV